MTPIDPRTNHELLSDRNDPTHGHGGTGKTDETPQAAAAAWQHRLVEALTENKITLNANGDIEDEGTFMGLYRYLDVAETEALIRSLDVTVSARACPFVGPVCGGFGWDPMACDQEIRLLLLPCLIPVALGPLINTEYKGFCESVRQVSYSLFEFQTKNGLSQGPALISREPDYLAYVVGEIKLALERNSMVGYAGVIEDIIGNPVLIGDDVRWKRKGAIGQFLARHFTVSESALMQATVDLWTIDWRALEDFW